VVLVEQGDAEAFALLLRREQRARRLVSVILHSESLKPLVADLGDDVVRILPQRVEGFARGYFDALRELDERKVDVILVETVSREGLGAAIMDRLERAAKL
jgi:L-threonylcarbamoyladenylate synthase